jgi:hypothetical protein
VSNVNQVRQGHSCRSAGGRLKNILFIVTVTTAFIFGLHSLFLAYRNNNNVQQENMVDLIRTAGPIDTEKINSALGSQSSQDLVFVVLESAEAGPDPEVEIAARNAARALANSGLAVSVRFLDPGDPNFMKIAAQNSLDRFPAVLAVKKSGGIVWVTDEINENNLLHAYQRVWGKTSSCDDAASAIY